MFLDYLVAIIVGGIIGWIATMLMGTEEGPLANIVIGIVGAALGRWFFGGVLNIGGAATAGTFTWWGLFWGIIGSAVLVAILKFFRVTGNRS